MTLPKEERGKVSLSERDWLIYPDNNKAPQDGRYVAFLLSAATAQALSEEEPVPTQQSEEAPLGKKPASVHVILGTAPFVDPDLE